MEEKNTSLPPASGSPEMVDQPLEAQTSMIVSFHQEKSNEFHASQVSDQQQQQQNTSVEEFDTSNEVFSFVSPVAAKSKAMVNSGSGFLRSSLKGDGRNNDSSRTKSPSPITTKEVLTAKKKRKKKVSLSSPPADETIPSSAKKSARSPSVHSHQGTANFDAAVVEAMLNLLTTVTAQRDLLNDSSESRTSILRDWIQSGELEKLAETTLKRFPDRLEQKNYSAACVLDSRRQSLFHGGARGDIPPPLASPVPSSSSPSPAGYGLLRVASLNNPLEGSRSNRRVSIDENATSLVVSAPSPTSNNKNGGRSSVIALSPSMRSTSRATSFQLSRMGSHSHLLGITPKQSMLSKRMSSMKQQLLMQSSSNSPGSRGASSLNLLTRKQSLVKFDEAFADFDVASAHSHEGGEDEDDDGDTSSSSGDGSGGPVMVQPSIMLEPWKKNPTKKSGGENEKIRDGGKVAGTSGVHLTTAAAAHHGGAARRESGASAASSNNSNRKRSIQDDTVFGMIFGTDFEVASSGGGDGVLDSPRTSKKNAGNSLSTNPQSPSTKSAGGGRSQRIANFTDQNGNEVSSALPSRPPPLPPLAASSSSGIGGGTTPGLVPPAYQVEQGSNGGGGYDADDTCSVASSNNSMHKLKSMGHRLQDAIAQKAGGHHHHHGANGERNRAARASIFSTRSGRGAPDVGSPAYRPEAEVVDPLLSGGVNDGDKRVSRSQSVCPSDFGVKTAGGGSSMSGGSFAQFSRSGTFRSHNEFGGEEGRKGSGVTTFTDDDDSSRHNILDRWATEEQRRSDVYKKKMWLLKCFHSDYLLILIIVNALWISAHIGLADEGNFSFAFIVFECIFDIISFIMMVGVTALLPYEHRGQVITDPKSTAKRYFTNADLFFVDLLSSFPCLPIFLMAGYSTTGNEIHFARLNIAFQAVRLPFVLDTVQMQLPSSIHPTIWRLALYLLMFFVIITYLAGCYLWCMRSVGFESASAWLQFPLETTESDPALRFLHGWYLASIIIADKHLPYPQTDEQFGFALFAAMVGLVVIAVILASVQDIIVGIVERSSVLSNRIEDTQAALKLMGMDSEELVEEIILYYRRMWAINGSFDYQDTQGQAYLQDLPDKLREDMDYQTNLRVLNEIPMFRSVAKDARFVRKFVGELRQVIMLPGAPIVSKGELGDCMFFLHSGDAAVLGGENGDEIIRYVSEGGFFGEVSVLFGGFHLETIVAVTLCNCYVITDTQFEGLIESFPEALGGILDAAVEQMKEAEARGDVTHPAMMAMGEGGGEIDLLSQSQQQQAAAEASSAIQSLSGGAESYSLSAPSPLAVTRQGLGITSPPPLVQEFVHPSIHVQSPKYGELPPLPPSAKSPAAGGLLRKSSLKYAHPVPLSSGGAGGTHLLAAPDEEMASPSAKKNRKLSGANERFLKAQLGNRFHRKNSALYDPQEEEEREDQSGNATPKVSDGHLVGLVTPSHRKNNSDSDDVLLRLQKAFTHNQKHHPQNYSLSSPPELTLEAAPTTLGGRKDIHHAPLIDGSSASAGPAGDDAYTKHLIHEHKGDSQHSPHRVNFRGVRQTKPAPESETNLQTWGPDQMMLSLTASPLANSGLLPPPGESGGEQHAQLVESFNIDENPFAAPTPSSKSYSKQSRSAHRGGTRTHHSPVGGAGDLDTSRNTASGGLGASPATNKQSRRSGSDKEEEEGSDDRAHRQATTLMGSKSPDRKMDLQTLFANWDEGAVEGRPPIEPDSPAS